MEYYPELGVTDSDESSFRTAKALQSIAYNIDDFIQLTYDTPGINSNGQLPVFNLEVWIEDNQVLHSFYRKSVYSQYIHDLQMVSHVKFN